MAMEMNIKLIEGQTCLDFTVSHFSEIDCMCVERVGLLVCFSLYSHALQPAQWEMRSTELLVSTVSVHMSSSQALQSDQAILNAQLLATSPIVPTWHQLMQQSTPPH